MTFGKNSPSMLSPNRDIATLSNSVGHRGFSKVSRSLAKDSWLY